jgi:two-component system cell cycle response regulator
MLILIAEDEPVSRRLLEHTLERWGHRVLSAADGDEAWHLLSGAAAPAIAILDRQMPGLDGLEICRRARDSVDLRARYLILLTASDRPQDIVHGLDAGADDYIAKPFHPEELRARLNAGERIVGLQQNLEAKIVQLANALDNVNSLVSFAHALTEALSGSAIREVLAPHLAVLAPGREVWVVTWSADRWEPSFSTVESNDDWVARKALASGTLQAKAVNQLQDDHVRLGGQLCFPMIVGDRVIGVFGVQEGEPPFDDAEQRALAAVAALLAIALRNVQLVDDLRERGIRDSLTGCVNRGNGFEVLNTELQRAKRSGRPLSVVMFDIDHFKELNDGHGHLCGDAALVAVAQCLSRVLRKSDVKCRYGGDEFLVILPDTPLSAAGNIGELLCQELSRLVLPAPYEGVSLSVSLGVVSSADGELDGGALLARADAALYRAKAGGKARVIVGLR